jgi:chloride channel protein, CIC family
MPHRKQNSFARRLRVNIHLLFRRLHIPSARFLDLIAIIVGYLTALGAFIFIEGIHYLEHHSRTFLGSLENPWIFPLVPAAGGLACGLMVYFFAREARGHGIPEVIYAVLMKGGLIRARVAVAKLFATVFSLGTLGSAGQEGPIVQIGSSVGSALGQALRLGSHSVKTLVGCGAAAGIAATFNAPIGGVVFALEVILGTFSPNVFTPIVVASVVSAVTFHSISGSDKTFLLNIHYSESLLEVFGFVAVGVFCGILAVIFVRSLDLFEKAFLSLKLPEYVKPAIGGLLVGLIMVFYSQIGGNSYSLVEDLVNQKEFALSLLVLLLALKLLATSCTLGSGGSGGVFAPSLVMGGLVGAWVHGVLSHQFPTSPVGIYVMVGMAAFVSGTTHGPIAAVLVLCEMTGHYDVILPLLAGCIVASIVARSLMGLSVYTIKLHQRGIILKDGHDVDVLKTYHVEDVMETGVEEVPYSLPLYEVLPILHDSPHEYVLVRDQDHRLAGVLSYFELTPFILEDHLNETAADAMHRTLDFVRDQDPVLKAYEKFLIKETSYLVVLNSNDSYVGLVFKKDIVRSYQKALHQKSLAMDA